MEPQAEPKANEGGVVGSSTITRKFQVTVPKKARERFNLKEGDLIMFVEEAGRLYLVKGKGLSFALPEPKSDEPKVKKSYYR